MSDLPVSFDDVGRAALRIDGVATRTPALTSRTLNSLFNCDAWFKCENFQRTGAFKFRGAYNALLQLSAKQKRAGVITYSSGNHAQAIALAGRLLDIPTTIVMPTDAPSVKLAATRSYGAEIIEYDRTRASREELGQRIAAERSLTLIPPYDHADVIAGQGTVAVELLDQAGHLDVFVAPCGGGGLLSGCALAIRSLNPNCRIVGVEPEAGDDAARSFATGTLQTVHNPETIADGARTPYLGKLTFPIVMAAVDDLVTVPDQALVRAMRFLWTRMKLVVEPTGALALAALLESRVDVSRQKVGIVISGGNIDLDHACRLFASCPEP
ncbi:MAG TPA: threo-3-hydroxy-L-aspartate ammonia-lyase [Rhodothermia bacterium]